MKKNIVIPILGFGLFCAFLACGCQKDNDGNTYEAILGELQWWQNDVLPKGIPEYHEKAELAISKWQNGILDSDPILVYSYIIQDTYPDGHNADLSTFTFDEDMDFLGLIIKEEYTDQQGNKIILEEDYPIFSLLVPHSDIAVFRHMKVYIRDNQQKKPVEQWEEYLAKTEEQLYDEFEGHPYNPGGIWYETLPPVYISLPEPNTTNVWISVYDKAGNVSEPISLLYRGGD